MSSLRSRIGFTLVELLVVIAIVGVLIAMSMPAIQMVREAARRTSCAKQASQVALALHSYEGSHRSLPPAIEFTKRITFLLHWQARLLPYIEQDSLKQLIDQKLLQDIHVYYITERTTTIPVFQCASNPESGSVIKAEIGFLFSYVDYCGVAGVQLTDATGVFIGSVEANPKRKHQGVAFKEITDGLSNTLMFGERPPSDVGEGYGAWLGSQNYRAATTGMFEDAAGLAGDPDLSEDCLSKDPGFGPGIRGSRCDWTHHWSFHPGGANFARADASVEFVPYDVDRETLSARATRNGGESIK